VTKVELRYRDGTRRWVQQRSDKAQRCRFQKKSGSRRETATLKTARETRGRNHVSMITHGCICERPPYLLAVERKDKHLSSAFTGSRLSPRWCSKKLVRIIYLAGNKFSGDIRNGEESLKHRDSALSQDAHYAHVIQIRQFRARVRVFSLTIPGYALPSFAS
jgi:hypothetical protein